MNLDELRTRLGDDDLVVLDVRGRGEYTGEQVAPCDPRPGRIPGAVHFDVQELLAASPEEVAERIGPPGGKQIVAYCHSGSRSAMATHALSQLGYDAANYGGSWHEWSRDDSLPTETG